MGLGLDTHHELAFPPGKPNRFSGDFHAYARGLRGLAPVVHMHRFSRLTNGFSKNVETHAHSMPLFMAYYNVVRIHKTLRTTPAMAAGVTKRL